MEKNVLYCGMGDDILTPLILEPDLDNLYVIDLFDDAFSPDLTWEGQKMDIIECLLNGSNEFSHTRDVYFYLLEYDFWMEENPDYKNQDPLTYLEHPCDINDDTQNSKFWKLTFTYRNKRRNLIHFYNTNFNKKWADEVKNISHLISLGTPFNLEDSFLKTMIKERCLPDCKYSDNGFHFKNEIEKQKLIDRDVFTYDLKSILK